MTTTQGNVVSIATESETSTPKPGYSNNSTNTAPGVSSHTASLSSSSSRAVILDTARVVLISNSDRKTEIRVLIDPCSQASFIIDSLAKKLKLDQHSCNVPVSGIGSTPTQTARSEASVLISPRIDSTKRWKLQALVLPRLTEYQSPPEMVCHDLSFVLALHLADPQLSSKEPIEMVLGVDAYTKIILSGLRKAPDEELIAQETALGWIVTGSSLSGHCSPHVSIQANSSVISMQCLIEPNLSSLLERFWKQEELALTRYKLSHARRDTV